MQVGECSHNDRVQFFLEESKQALVTMEQAVRTLERSPGDAGPVGTLLQAAHGLQDDAGSLGFRELADVSFELEDILERVHAGSIAVCADLVEVLALSLDVLREMLSEARA